MDLFIKCHWCQQHCRGSFAVQNSRQMRQQTIAIFGANTAGGVMITTGLAAGKHKLLLPAGENLADAQWMAIDLQKHFPTADVEAVDCGHEAAWEADIIIAAVGIEELTPLCEKIKDVASRKIVVHVTDAVNENIAALYETLLPHSKHVNVITEWSGKKSVVFVQSNNGEALEQVADILDEAGITPVTTPYSEEHKARA
jgi:predicted dinucleotide-binding enzyme